ASDVTLTSGAPLQLTTQFLNLGANSSVVSTVTSGPGISVFSSINGPKPLTINLPGGSSATMSTLGGSISFSPSSGNVVIATVTPAVDQPVSFVSSGGNAALILTGGPVTITTVNGPATGGSTTIGADVTVISGSSITITTPQLILNDGSVINSLSASTINITSPPGSDLTIQAPSGGFATIQTAPGVLSYSPEGQPITGSINISPAYGKSLSIVKSLGDPATLNLDGGPVVITTTTDPATMTTASTTIGSGVTLASDSLIVMNINDGTLSNSGLIRSSASGISPQFRFTPTLVSSFGSVITIESLSGSLTLAGNGLGYISATGAGGAPFFFNTLPPPGLFNIGPNISVLAYGHDSVN